MVEELRLEKAAKALEKKLKEREEQLKKKKISKNQVLSGIKAEEKPAEKSFPEFESPPKIEEKELQLEQEKVFPSSSPLSKLKEDILQKKKSQLLRESIEEEKKELKPLPKVFSEPAAKEKIEELSRFISTNVEKEEKVEGTSVAEQLGSIKNYFSGGLKKSMGKKEIGKVYLNELSESELREAKKLIPLLEPETKRYAREEIFEAILMEGHSKKVAKAVISALYQN